MAHRRPTQLTLDVQKDPFRAAERRVFDRASDLPADWYVLYGVAWLRTEPGRGSTEGEADFVFVGPDIGVVVVEVKGGRVGRDADGWYSIDRTDRRHAIHDPAFQATRSKHNLLAHIRADARFRSTFVPASHCVVFPNVLRRDLPRLPELPADFQIAADDLDRLELAIRRCAAVSSREDTARLSSKECEAIADILKPSFSMPGRWCTAARFQLDVMKRLTLEQEEVLRSLTGNRVIGLTGPAGSGKTLLALLRARETIAGGGRVLCCVPSVLLRHYFAAMLGISDALSAVSHAELLQQAGLDALATQWDLIVIDEAQSLSLDEWDVAERLLEASQRGSMLCVYDSNQRIRRRGSFYLPHSMVEASLTRVIRNTRQIGAVSRMFYANDRSSIALAGPDGVGVQELPLNSSDDLREAVSAFVRRMVDKEGFSYADIVVLFGASGGTLLKSDAPPTNGVSFRDPRYWWDTGHRKNAIVACGHVSTFLGLESPVVVLADVEDAIGQDLLAALYVGVTRARHVLAIAATREALRRIRDAAQSAESSVQRVNEAPCARPDLRLSLDASVGDLLADPSSRPPSPSGS